MRNIRRREQKQKYIKFLEIGEKTIKTSGSESLAATKARMALIGMQLFRAYKRSTTLVWRSFLVPTEIFYATGALPFTPEIACASFAQNQAALRKLVQKAEELHYEPKLCSFIKSMIGGMHAGILPEPDVIIGSPSFCAGMGSILGDVARFYGSAYFYLDIPLDYSPDSVDYLAGQLEKLAALLAAKTGMEVRQVNKERLPQAIEYSNQAGEYWQKIKELRRTVPSPMSGSEALDYATVLAQTWGSPEIVDIYSLLFSELKQRVEQGIPAIPNEKLRILWLHLRPYYPNKIFEALEEHGAVVAFEEVNFPARNKMDPSAPYRSLARELLSNGGQYRIPVKRAKDLVQVARDYKIDGAIHFSHENCEYSKTSFPTVFEKMQQENDIPLLNLNSDCLVDEHSELLRTRVHAFLEVLEAKKQQGRDPEPGYNPSSCPTRSLSGVFLGIDVGAATTKAVVLNQKGSGHILGWSVFPTGSDSSQAVKCACDDAFNKAGGLSLEACERIAATGVGCENVSMADQTITEISCHTAGIKYVLPQAKTLIDIGGQDTKVIFVQNLRFRMNDACAAGTGKFLVAMAAALGISLDDLAKRDAQTRQALGLSRMCTVFAESEVVSLVARGASVESIVRGIHEMVADRTLTLLRQLSPVAISPLAMSGGVALNLGVVRALERGIGETILVPKNPQIIGALGAAIIAAKYEASA